MGFDEYAADYEAALDQGISVSGENRDYFARSRVAWLAGCLEQLGKKPKLIMDYGCGTGSAATFLLNLLSDVSILGVDVSRKSLEVARQVHGLDRTRFLLFDEYQPNKEIDLVFLSYSSQ